MKLLESIKAYGGQQQRWQHQSRACNCTMTFSVFLPGAEPKNLAVLYWLSGLTCNDQNFSTKSGAQRLAALHNLMLVIPDTSPRGEGVADADRYDLGQGAGFYVNSTQSPWREHFQMYAYVTEELPALVEANFPVQANRRSISGHSMGGHGALICALKNPGYYRSVSAFAPICHPANCGWGQGCLGAYLGDDRELWAQYDAWQLLSAAGKVELPILIDQGADDAFFQEQLQSDKFAEHAASLGVQVDYRLRPGYDHSYYYVSSFLEEHFQFHAAHLATS